MASSNTSQTCKDDAKNIMDCKHVQPRHAETTNTLQRENLDRLIQQFEKGFNRSTSDVADCCKTVASGGSHVVAPRSVRPKSGVVHHLAAVVEMKEWLEKSGKVFRMVQQCWEGTVFTSQTTLQEVWHPDCSLTRKSHSFESLTATQGRYFGSTDCAFSRDEVNASNAGTANVGNYINSRHRSRSFSERGLSDVSFKSLELCPKPLKKSQTQWPPAYKRTVSDYVTARPTKKEAVQGRSRSVTFSEETDSCKKKRLQRTPTPYWSRGELIHEETIYGDDYDIGYDTACDKEVCSWTSSNDSKSGSPDGKKSSMIHRKEPTANFGSCASPLLHKLLTNSHNRPRSPTPSASAQNRNP